MKLDYENIISRDKKTYKVCIGARWRQRLAGLGNRPEFWALGFGHTSALSHKKGR